MFANTDNGSSSSKNDFISSVQTTLDSFYNFSNSNKNCPWTQNFKLTTIHGHVSTGQGLQKFLKYRYATILKVGRNLFLAAGLLCFCTDNSSGHFSKPPLTTTCNWSAFARIIALTEVSDYALLFFFFFQYKMVEEWLGLFDSARQIEHHWNPRIRASDV